MFQWPFRYSIWGSIRTDTEKENGKSHNLITIILSFAKFIRTQLSSHCYCGIKYSFTFHHAMILIRWKIFSSLQSVESFFFMAFFCRRFLASHVPWMQLPYIPANKPSFRQNPPPQFWKGNCWFTVCPPPKSRKIKENKSSISVNWMNFLGINSIFNSQGLKSESSSVISSGSETTSSE